MMAIPARAARSVAAFASHSSSTSASRLALAGASSSSLFLTRSIQTIRTPSTLTFGPRNSFGLRTFTATAGLHNTDANSGHDVVAELEAGADAQGAVTGRKSFASLNKHGVRTDLVKALTSAPFNYKEMSEVQDRVSDHIQDVVAPTKGSAPLPGYKPKNGKATMTAEESADLGKNGTLDLFVKAKTGTGKTIAFLLPAVEARLRALDGIKEGSVASEAFLRLLHKNQPDFDYSEMMPAHQRKFAERTYARNAVGALIISPTRELATQIAQEAKKLAKNIPGFGVHLLIGGASKGTQLRQWNSERLDIVVATPGRLLSHLYDGAAVASAVSATETFILDEADTLLEMGFNEELAKVRTYLPPKERRRNLLFSATVSKAMRETAQDTMSARREFLDCVPEGESNVHASVVQTAHVVDTKDQLNALVQLLAKDQLQHGAKSRAIVFCPTAKMTQLVGAFLRSEDLRSLLPIGLPNDRSKGLEIWEIHSKLTQPQRDRASAGFRKSREPRVLVSSDVSARGVDYPDVTRVIQMGFPLSTDLYVHRIGRTGRAGKQGHADLVLMKGIDDAWPLKTAHAFPINTKKGGLEALKAEVAEQWDAVRGEQNRPTQPASEARLFQPEEVDVAVGKALDDANELAPILEDDARSGTTKDGYDGYDMRFDQATDAVAAKRSVWRASVSFYLGRTVDLHRTKAEVYRALQRWGMDSLRLPESSAQLSQTALFRSGVSEEQLRKRQSGMGKPERFGSAARTASSDRRSFGGRGRSSGFGDSDFGGPRRSGGRDRDRGSWGQSSGDNWGSSRGSDYGSGGRGGRGRSDSGSRFGSGFSRFD